MVELDMFNGKKKKKLEKYWKHGEKSKTMSPNS